MNNGRINRVLEELDKKNIGQMLICDSSSIRYLTGISVCPGERFWGMLLSREECILIANDLFNVSTDEYRVIRYSDNDGIVDVLRDHLDICSVLGVDKMLAARFLIPLQEAFPGMKTVLASRCVDDVRAVKDEDECDRMREASMINDIVIEEAFTFIREGMSEREVSDFIAERYAHYGCDGPSFTTIVSFGATAADPHHEPDDTRLQHGQCVLLDMGCLKNGYCSDMTRTRFYGSVSEKNREVYDLVLKANLNAESIIRPGVRLCDIDRAARKVIEDGGYGRYFTHRLGHFIGQDVHEFGDVSASFADEVKPGMIFSIEPGIYLEGDFGVRIEDLVLVTEEGCEVLNRADKSLIVMKAA